MKQLILKLFFGSDEMVSHFFTLLRVRKAAIKEHTNNQRLSAELAEGLQKLAGHKASYTQSKDSVMAAFHLEI